MCAPFSCVCFPPQRASLIPPIMMERVESEQKLYTRMRLWEFPDQYVVEPTDGSCGSSLAVSRVDGTMNLIGGFTNVSLSFVFS